MKTRAILSFSSCAKLSYQWTRTATSICSIGCSTTSIRGANTSKRWNTNCLSTCWKKSPKNRVFSQQKEDLRVAIQTSLSITTKIGFQLPRRRKTTTTAVIHKSKKILRMTTALLLKPINSQTSTNHRGKRKLTLRLTTATKRILRANLTWKRTDRTSKKKLKLTKMRWLMWLRKYLCELQTRS